MTVRFAEKAVMVAVPVRHPQRKAPSPTAAWKKAEELDTPVTLLVFACAHPLLLVNREMFSSPTGSVALHTNTMLELEKELLSAGADGEADGWLLMASELLLAVLL